MTLNYKEMSDDDLLKIASRDPDAYYEYYLRHRSGKYRDISSKCGKRIDDVNYYGDPDEGNR